MAPLKARQRFGKYIIERRLAEGGFATVYQAKDTIEGIRVALKIPYAHLLTDEMIEYFKQEVRLAARLEHPNILPLKYADYIDKHFVIVTALGKMSLEDRLQKRASVATAIDYASQMLAAVAYAHQQLIIHCDIKPENFLIFSENRIRLADFGIARVAQRTLLGSGAGTVGYIAPEQAMGKPSLRSDVFSLGIVFYRMFSGCLPEWPYRWPPPGYDRLRRSVHPNLVALIRRAIEVDAKKRYRDAQQMQAAFKRIRSPVKRGAGAKTRTPQSRVATRDWQSIRRREFQRRFGRVLETTGSCSKCSGPVAETMQACPWCGKSRRIHEGDIRFPVCCPRCRRGLKSDWSYCPWCYGAGFEVPNSRAYTDRRYVGRCGNAACPRKVLMPFMKYCPWCHRRVRKKWKIDGSRDQCGRCGWGLVRMYWSYCPWCAKRVQS